MFGTSALQILAYVLWASFGGTFVTIWEWESMYLFWDTWGCIVNIESLSFLFIGRLFYHSSPTYHIDSDYLKEQDDNLIRFIFVNYNTC